MQLFVIATLHGPVMVFVMRHVPMPAESRDRLLHARTTLFGTWPAAILQF